MSEDLYQKDLLRLAAEAAGHGRLPAPQVSVTMDNPLCGDRITLDLSLADGHVSELEHEVKACVLCQASATLVGRHAKGATPAALAAVAQRIAALLKQPEETELPDGWEDVAALKPAARIKSRHACVLLPFRALQEALSKAEAKATR